MKLSSAERTAHGRWLTTQGAVSIRWWEALGCYSAVLRKDGDEWWLVWGLIGDLRGHRDAWVYDGPRQAPEAALLDWDLMQGGEPQGWAHHTKSGRRRVLGSATMEYGRSAW